MGLVPGWFQTGTILPGGGIPSLPSPYKSPDPPVTSGEAGWTVESKHLHHALETSQVWAHALIHAFAESHRLQSHYWSSKSSVRPSRVWTYSGCGQGHIPLVTGVLKYNADCISLSSWMGLAHHLHLVNLNVFSFQGVTCLWCNCT